MPAIYSPFASIDGLAAANRSDWDEESGKAAAEQGRWSDALTSFQRAVRFNPDHAELHFQLAQCFSGIGAWAPARSEYVLARDLDALPFRADSCLNRLLEDAA